MHYIQKHILSILTHAKDARFSDMKPSRVDSNLYTYHLKALVTSGLVVKYSDRYQLSPSGLAYVDRISSEKFELRVQPKIISMLCIENESSEVLLWKKSKQPFIGSWSLPYGKIHIDDESMMRAAIREVNEKVGLQPEFMQHAGMASIRVTIGDAVISYVQAHIFRAKLDSSLVISSDLLWSDTESRNERTLAPATEKIIQKTRSSDSFFFESYPVSWTD